MQMAAEQHTCENVPCQAGRTSEVLQDVICAQHIDAVDVHRIWTALDEGRRTLLFLQKVCADVEVEYPSV